MDMELGKRRSSGNKRNSREMKEMNMMAEEYSFETKRKAASAAEQAQKILSMGLSESSDSDSDENSILSSCSGQSEDSQDVDKEGSDNEGPGRVVTPTAFEYHSLEELEYESSVPKEMINIFLSREDLFWILQHNLLIKWYLQKQQQSDNITFLFPSIIASTLFKAVYSAKDVIISSLACDTLCALFTKCSTKRSFWNPTMEEFRQSIRFLSLSDSPVKLELNMTHVRFVCRVICKFFHAVLLDLKLSDSIDKQEWISLWKDLVQFGFLDSVRDRGLMSAVNQSSKAVLEAFMACCCKSPSRFEELSNLVYDATFLVCSPGKKSSLKSQYRKYRLLVDSCELLELPSCYYLSTSKGGFCSISTVSQEKIETCNIERLHLSHVAFQIMIVELFLLSHFGSASQNTLSRLNYDKTSHQWLQTSFDGDDNISSRFEVRQYCHCDNAITSPRDTIRLQLAAIWGGEAKKCNILRVVVHYLHENCRVLNKLSSVILKKATTDAAHEVFKWENHLDSLIVLFKVASLNFSILIGLLFLPNSSTGEIKCDIDTNSNGTKEGKKTDDTGLNMDDIKNKMEEFIEEMNTFKPFLRKRKSLMGITSEISYIVDTVNDKWSFVKQCYFTK